MNKKRRSKVIKDLNKFAAEHNLILETEGEIGFGRPCVGLVAGRRTYLDYNPIKMSGNYNHIWPYDSRLEAPAGVHAYHKHNCFAVLVGDEEAESFSHALAELHAWIRALEKIGDVEVVQYQTGATDFQALVTGTIGYALRFKDKSEEIKNER